VSSLLKDESFNQAVLVVGRYSADMQIKDKVAIVTGGGSGIGEALAKRFHDEGASGVVVVDRDGSNAERVAQTIGATAVELDVTDESGIVDLVNQTVKDHGTLDIFVSNAGYVTQGGVEADNDEIQRMWEVHVMSHIYAARASIPVMVANGGGYLLNTASAAGLLTQLGSMQYSITKAAAVSLGEFLAITYGERGIRVSMLCPQAVETNILANSPDRLDQDRGTPGSAAGDGVLTAEQLADTVIECMTEERFLVLPHPEVQTYRERKANDVDRWISGMQRFQSQLFADGDFTPADWLLS
jgi:NAD(P)-dependent dehydrogenase (short-subunit alcohol dehydrogenase family)|tara:strand:+ start:183 stop:1079 length:897 start_codon:yes stop_codon:yes gene_type:complete